MEYLDRAIIERVSHQAFQAEQPYPWVSIPQSLTAEGYERLRTSIPEVTLFDKKVGIKRAYGQGYHDRYILHYRPHIQLHEPWKEFVAELQGDFYQSFLRRMLGPNRYILTLEWYYAWRGCQVTPHCDARRKLATHIFYFNTETDWQADWGGTILILDDERRFKPHSGHSFDEFKVAADIDPRGNSSLLFQRTDHSWHGVRPLQPPPNVLRKLFIVTVNIPTFQVWWRRVRGKDPDGYRFKAEAAGGA